jgi:hypothetical protein
VKTRTTALGAGILLLAAGVLFGPFGLVGSEDDGGVDAGVRATCDGGRLHTVAVVVQLDRTRSVTIEFEIGTDKYTTPTDERRWADVVEDVRCGTIIGLRVIQNRGSTGTARCGMAVDGQQIEAGYVSGRKTCALTHVVK